MRMSRNVYVKALVSLFSQSSSCIRAERVRPEEKDTAVMANRGAATRPSGSNTASKICQFKLVLLGESAVGKSSLVLRFVKGQFHEFQESTIGGE